MCDRCAPSRPVYVDSPVPKLIIMLMMEHCKHAVKSLVEMLSPCLTPLCSLILSLSLCSFRVDVESRNSAQPRLLGYLVPQREAGLNWM